MGGMTPNLDRQQLLSAAAAAFTERAQQLARAGDLERAMLMRSMADAVRHTARGDKLGRKLALKEARALRFAQRRRALRGVAA